jgi:hypothetical protein
MRTERESGEGVKPSGVARLLCESHVQSMPLRVAGAHSFDSDELGADGARMEINQ